jgi:hypothetical protein
MKLTDQSIRKITFTTRQLELADYRSKKLGLNFQAYIRYLVSKDTESLSETGTPLV